MKRSTRMMLMSSGNNRRYNDGRSYDNYDVDDKFRDRRGREHYDNGRYAPRSEMMEPEDRGYRRYSDGRFAPRNDGGMWVESRYWDDRMYGPQSHYGYPYVPPVYREDGSAYTERREMNRPMNKIGFAISGDGLRIWTTRMAPVALTGRWSRPNRSWPSVGLSATLSSSGRPSTWSIVTTLR